MLLSHVLCYYVYIVHTAVNSIHLNILNVLRRTFVKIRQSLQVRRSKYAREKILARTLVMLQCMNEEFKCKVGGF